MALQIFLCGVTVTILLTLNGCHAVKPACGMRPKGHPEHLPWQAVITINRGIKCLGSLITSQYVLTDGHCGFGPEYDTMVSLGRMDMSDPANNCEESRAVVHVLCNKHTPYSLLTKDSVCLLELSHPVNFTDFIFPVCVATGDSTIHSETESWVATGAQPKALVKVPVVGYNECKCSKPRLQEHMICAGSVEEHRPKLDGCLDNLGGALVVDDRGYWTMIGVASLDQNCPPLESLKSYSSVSRGAEFLTNATASNPPGFAPIRHAGMDPDRHFICQAPVHPETSMPPKISPPVRTRCPLSHDVRPKSVFDSGVSVMPFSPFLLLCVLILSLYGTKW